MLRKIFLVLLALALLAGAPVSLAQEMGCVQFGTYKTQADGSTAPIVWKLLSDNAGGVLLLSEYVLDARPVQSEGRFNGYEYSEIKRWLEGEFFEQAFVPGEQALIALEDGTPLVTLPSVEELREKDGGFFDTEGLRARPTPYAVKQGVQKYSGGDASYWTRTRSQSNAGSQRRVMEKGSFGYSPASYSNIGVRPMLRLVSGALADARGAGTLNDPFILSLPAVTPATPPPEATEAPETETQDTLTQSNGQPAAQGEPLLIEGFPPLTAQGFLPAGQAPYVFKDEEQGVWRYASPTLRLVITRHQDIDNKLRWFESHIFFTEDESFQMYPFDPGNRRKMSPMEKIANKYNLVYALNGDYYIYRVNMNRDGKKFVIGKVARDFKILYDQPINPNRKTHPNLDVMALYPDGSMSVHGANEMTAEQLIKAGARDVLSFGPWLVRDGEINVQGVANFGVTQQPRAGLGMVGKGHFLHIVVESRTSKSKGVNTTWLAERFQAQGCGTAFNLDGGQTAVLIFMGEQLNEIGKYDGKTNSREQNEIMGIGTR
ncbi:MAG: phosphodiester glycosidase family protein [Christensenellales bacterium]|jgi:hypothetical protein